MMKNHLWCYLCRMFSVICPYRLSSSTFVLADILKLFYTPIWIYLMKMTRPKWSDHIRQLCNRMKRNTLQAYISPATGVSVIPTWAGFGEHVLYAYFPLLLSLSIVRINIRNININVTECYISHDIVEFLIFLVFFISNF